MLTIKLTIKTHGRYPIIKPPVIPKIIPIPPLKEEKTGSPIIPKNIYIKTAKNAPNLLLIAPTIYIINKDNENGITKIDIVNGDTIAIIEERIAI